MDDNMHAFDIGQVSDDHFMAVAVSRLLLCALLAAPALAKPPQSSAKCEESACENWCNVKSKKTHCPSCKCAAVRCCADAVVLSVLHLLLNVRYVRRNATMNSIYEKLRVRSDHNSYCTHSFLAMRATSTHVHVM